MNPWGHLLGLQSLPCLLQNGSHSQQVSATSDSHAPCSTLPDTHYMADRNGDRPCPFPACLPKFGFSMPSWNWTEISVLPCGDVYRKMRPIMLRFDGCSVQTGDSDTKGTKQYYVLLQTEKADRRQNFVSLALRKRYSYLTEPGMSELLLPKY